MVNKHFVGDVDRATFGMVTLFACVPLNFRTILY